MIAIMLSRLRVHSAGGLIRAGNRILASEERRWGLAPVPAGWRVPNTSH
jgi:hypothetical protein